MIRLLIVHRDVEMGRELVQMVRDYTGYESALTGSESETLVWLRRQPEVHPRILLTQLDSPGLDGFALGAMLGEMFDGLQTLFLPPYSAAEQRIEIADSKIFPEPIDGERLIATIERSVRMIGSAADLFQGIDVLQMCCLARRSGAVQMVAGGNVGTVYLREGQIVHAETSNAQAEAALIEIVSWGEIEFAYDGKIDAPWREWNLTSRTKLLEFAEEHQIPIAKDKRGEAPFSVDANLLHISAEGKALEDPWHEPEEFVYSRSVAPEQAPDQPTYVEIEFLRGDPVALDGEALSPAGLLTKLNQLGGANGIGRLDLVENRFVGMKSRGVYETPGGTILAAAHRGIESLTLDRGAMHLKDDVMPRYAELIYNGFWFSPEREMLQALIDKSQEHVEGTVRLKLYKGSVRVVGRKSPKSLYSLAHVTFEADQVYDQRDAEGFIKLNALRLRLLKRGRG